MPRAHYIVACVLALLLPPIATAAEPAAAPKKNYASAGQAAIPNALVFTVGGGIVQLRDEALLPLAHRGPGALARVGYLRSQQHHIHELELGMAIYAPASRIDDGSQHLALDLHYTYLHHVLDIGEFDEKHRKPASLWLGGVAGGGPSIQSYPQIDEAHAYWHTSYQLRPVALLYWQAKPRLAWIQRLELPVLSVVSRPAAQRTYFNDIPKLPNTLALAHSDIGAQFAHRAGRLRGVTALEYPLHRRVQQRVAYELSYDYARVGPHFQALSQMLQWQTLWSF